METRLMPHLAWDVWATKVLRLAGRRRIYDRRNDQGSSGWMIGEGPIGRSAPAPWTAERKTDIVRRNPRGAGGHSGSLPLSAVGDSPACLSPTLPPGLVLGQARSGWVQIGSPP
jgi:hypothetical protein